MRRILPIFLAAAIGSSALGADPAPYADPDGTLALHPPTGWEVHREKADPVVSIEVAPAEGPGPRAYLLCVTSKSHLSPEQLPDIAATLTKVGIVALREDSGLLSRTAADARFHGRDALRTDVRARVGSGTYVSHLTVVLGKSHAYLLAATAVEGDVAGMKAAEETLDSVGLESDRPAPDRGLFTAATIARVVDEVQGLSPADPSVLVAGEPPLTVGAVRGLAAAAEKSNAMHLTVAEEEALRGAVMATYRAAGGAERARLAAAGRQPVAPDGSAWGEAIGQAVARRGAVLQNVRGALPKAVAGQQIDTRLTDGDVDAAAEMLLFMWVATGRPPTAVTAASLTELRDSIGVEFPRMATDEQVVFANAPRVYAGLRAAWKSAAADRRAGMAESFAAVLDALALRQTAASTHAGREALPVFERFNADPSRAASVLATCWAFAH